MFVQNKTSLGPILARADVSDDLTVATIVLRVPYRLAPGAPNGLLPWEGPRTPLDTDPPSTGEQAIWEGTSVTVAATVPGPSRPPHVVRLDLAVGAETRTLRVHGDRRWLRNAGKLIPSTPAAFGEKALSWALAFGGAYTLPPGPDPASKRPHPGGLVQYVPNPGGTGFYPSEKAAEDQPLPSIEWQEGTVARWTDQPRPAGFAPCPELSALRAPTVVSTAENDVEWHFRATLRLLHHAPAELIFDGLAPGTPVRLSGLSSAPIAFEIPRSPVSVETVRGRSAERIGFRIRSVHVSAADGAVLVDYAHGFAGGRTGSPAWVRIEAA